MFIVTRTRCSDSSVGAKCSGRKPKSSLRYGALINVVLIGFYEYFVPTGRSSSCWPSTEEVTLWIPNALAS